MISLHTLPQRIARDLGGVLSRGQLNSGTVLMHWDASEAPEDPNLEADYAAAAMTSRRFTALIHFVSVRAAERGFGEIQAGDAIITFGAPMPIEGKRGVSFTLPDGRDYVQQAVGKKIAEFWDVYVGGAPLTTTLLLRSTGGAAAPRRCIVRHVEGGVNTELYAFDFASRRLSVLDDTLLAGRALIDTTVPDALTISIGGTVALTADAAGVRVAALDADGISAVGEPRLEWVRGGAVLAALGQNGTLSVPGYTQSATQPVGTDDFQVLNPGWLLSLGAVASSPQITETL